MEMREDIRVSKEEAIQASVGILTFNSAETLERALESVRMFDDIVLCDGGSTDGTLEIARAFGARVISQSSEFKNPNGTLKNFGGVRQQLLNAAKHEWFLYIDSDETISDGLREEIRNVVHAAPDGPPGTYPLVYRVPYGIVIDGHPIKYASNFPGYQHRFFNKKSGAHFIKEVHERITFDTNQVTIGTFKNPWYTYAARKDAWLYLQETKRYRQLEVRSNAHSLSLSKFLYVFVWRCARTSLGAFLKSLRNYLLHGFANSAPLGDEVGRTLSPLLLMGDAIRERWFGSNEVVDTARHQGAKELLWRLFPRYFRKRYFGHAKNGPARTARVEPELLLTAALLKESRGLFLDVGANLGAFLYSALEYRSASELIAFEPQPHYVRRMRALFPGVRVEQVALSSSSGEVQLKIPRIKGKLYETRGTLERFVDKGEESAVYITVPRMTLDEYVAERKLENVGMIKIDVEGHEREVLAGAEKTLLRDLPILFIEIEQRQHESPIEETFMHIRSFGYTGWFFDMQSGMLASLNSFSKEVHQDLENFKTSKYVNNFLFLPESMQPPTFSVPPDAL